jgi:RNA polymerase sigma-70 factor (ECF subfamily)
MHSPDRPSRTQDEWIVLRCRAGEASGFEDLVRMMQQPLFYYATKLTGNAETALDVLQDVWVKVFREIRRLKNPGALRAWLYKIAHGVAVDRIRREVARERTEESYCGGAAESDEVTFSNEDAAAIHEALNELAPSHREVLVLYFLEEFSLAEIAMITGCPEGTIKSRMHYAKRAMKKILSGGGYGTSE